MSVWDLSSSLSSRNIRWCYRGQAVTDILSKLKSFWGQVQENIKGKREKGRKNFTWVSWIPNNSQTSMVLMPLLFSLHHPFTLIVKLPANSGQFTTASSLSPDESISTVYTSWFVLSSIFLSLLVCQVTRQVDIGECELVGAVAHPVFLWSMSTATCPPPDPGHLLDSWRRRSSTPCGDSTDRTLERSCQEAS